jgi:Tfp pilus assembly protein PilV
MPRLRAESGSIYLEALIAIAVLSLALLPLIGAFIITPAAHRQAGQQMAALNLARGRLESLHALSGDSWDDLDEETTIEAVDGQEYTVHLVVEPERPDQEGLRHVRVVVTWTGRGQERRVSLATAVARRP